MRKVNTSARLKEIMEARSLKQVDILKMVEPYCKLYDISFGKSALSQYISGKVEPTQNKLFVLSKALNVSEAWLMGFDVSASRLDDIAFNLSNDEKQVITAYREQPPMQEAVKRLLGIDN